MLLYSQLYWTVLKTIFVANITVQISCCFWARKKDNAADVSITVRILFKLLPIFFKASGIGIFKIIFLHFLLIFLCLKTKLSLYLLNCLYPRNFLTLCLNYLPHAPVRRRWVSACVDLSCLLGSICNIIVLWSAKVKYNALIQSSFGYYLKYKVHMKWNSTADPACPLPSDYRNKNMHADKMILISIVIYTNQGYSYNWPHWNCPIKKCKS